MTTKELISAVSNNTKATRENTAELRKLNRQQDKETRREVKRKSLIGDVPYSRDALLMLKRQDLVMLAAQLGIKNTSVPQKSLMRAVLDKQPPI